jgi:outer membrane protein assembly factor BamE
MINTNPTHRFYCFVLLPTLLLVGCSSTQWNHWAERASVIKPYRIEIAQGNVVTKEQMQTIQIGATTDEVRDQLGSPTLMDVFHSNRWDYHFSFSRDGQPLQQRIVTLFFQEGRLKKIEAPDLPSEAEFSASISTFKPTSKAFETELTPDQRKTLPTPTRKTSPAQTAPQGAARAYPPLETTP